MARSSISVRNGVGRLVLLLCLAALTSPLPAGTKLYTLQIPESQPANFRLELPVEHAGTLILRLEWSIDRLLALRLEAPGAWDPPKKVSGPSPLFMEVEVAVDQARAAGRAAVVARGARRRLHDLGVSGEIQVVAAREEPDLAAVDAHARPLRAPEHAHAPVGSARTNRVEWWSAKRFIVSIRSSKLVLPQMDRSRVRIVDSLHRRQAVYSNSDLGRPPFSGEKPHPRSRLRFRW